LRVVEYSPEGTDFEMATDTTHHIPMSMKNILLERLILPASDVLLGNSVMKSLNGLRSAVTSEYNNRARLDSLLRHAMNNIPYYRSLGIPETADPLERLSTFPLLTKPILRERADDLLCMPREKLIRNSSSGSSGFQSVVYWTRAQQSSVRATQLLWLHWAGYRFGDPILQTGITPRRGLVKGAKDMLTGTYYLQAFSHSREDARKALAWASRQKDPVLVGYASSFYVLACFAKELGMEVRFKTALSWGDKLFPHYRKGVKEAFGCDVYETYGSAEGFMMAAQKDLEQLYIMTPNVHLEITDEAGKAVPDGEMGHVVVTDLNAWAMPLIRYRIGDLAIKLPQSDRPRQSSLHLPLLKKVVGRETDIVRTPGGRQLVVHAFTGIFEHHPEISQFCVIQEERTGIRIQYIEGPGFHDSLLLTIGERIREAVKEPFEIIFESVESIPATPSGKPQLIVSRIR
jgi:phenylacetate-CoA ligase